MCSGRVDSILVMKALSSGAHGVLIAQCHPSDCHYTGGNVKRTKRFKLLQRMLDQLGIERDRVRLEWVSPSEGERYTQVAENMTLVKELSVSGFKLVEEILGYDEVTIVDSYAGEDTNAGQIREFGLGDFEDTLHTSSPHGANFATALELYKNLQPDKIPRKIRIFTINIHRTDTFGERLSKPIRDAALKVTEIIVREVEQGGSAQL
jgi:hydrogenase maturation protease